MMRRIALIIALVLAVVLIVAYVSASTGYAEVSAGPGNTAAGATYPTWVGTGDASPHGGYSTTTNNCVQCHEVHDAQGDYVLTREATVTATCGTCHGLFGDSAPIPEATGTTRSGWTDMPPDLSSSILGPTATPDGPVVTPTASQYPAYQKNMRASQFINPDGSVNTANVDAIPGHSLGVMLDGSIVRGDDSIPSGTNPLVVMTSGLGTGNYPHAYAAGQDGMPRYSGDSVTSYDGTKGLYCASCHTPHGTTNSTAANPDGTGALVNNWGQQLNDPLVRHAAKSYMLLSSRPNHQTTDVTSYEGFCQACHDQKTLNRQTDASGVLHNNHPPFCVSCHGNPSNDPTSKDFPHTSTNPYLLTSNGDGICKGCHPAGSLP